MEKEYKPLPEGWYRTPKGKTLRIPKETPKKQESKLYNNNLTKPKKQKSYKISYLSMEDFELLEYGRKKTNFSKVVESAGEKIIKKYLEEKQIAFAEQAVFENCINPKTKRKLRFDFFIPCKNLCIEFDGKQHYKESKEFHGEKSKEALESQKFRDSIKTDFCKENKIKLLRIPYFKINKIKSILNKHL